MRADHAVRAEERLDPREALAGVVERVTYHNESNGFIVVQVKPRGQRELVTVVGHAATLSVGEFIEAVGAWVMDRTHGRQFKADRLHAAPPSTIEGIVRYLGSGMVKGIGPKTAKRIVAQFGEKTFEIIETDPARLRTVAGIGRWRAAQIRAAWAEQKSVRDIMVFLHDHGVGTARAVRIFKTYGPEALGIITANPYRLAHDIRGIGFRTADAMAQRLGLSKHAPQRLRAGIAFALETATDEGHCGLPVDELIRLAERLLDVPAEPIRDALKAELAAAAVVHDTIGGRSCAFLRGLYAAESGIAGRLMALSRGQPPWPTIEATKAIPWVESRTGKALSASQRDAMAVALASKVAVITGGPGVGKTTLLDAILTVLAAKGVRILLAAPTGRAARRMTEQTGMEAKTVHRLLEVDPSTASFRRDADNPLEADLLVVDEASMLDVPLMHAIVKALPQRMGLLLVGDVDQLPSVGPGRVLADTIASGAIPVARLTEVFRQAASSRIITSAHRINRGQIPEWPVAGEASDFFFVEAKNPDDGATKIVEIVRDRIPRRFGLDPLRDVQVLCPMQRGALGARALNVDLQKALNPHPPARIEKFGSTFATGDKVMQIANDYEREVFNGDVGRLLRIDEDAGSVHVGFYGREVSYGFTELDALVPAYAVTVHKSQGSEYPAVIITCALQHYTMLVRNLLYTAVTRGKQLVVVVGERRALALAVNTADARRRWTKLGEWLARAPA
ncbi:MAG TPA: ATP-dependent RecD-like DNA helicase [Xanthobacteraceae bacterium]|nr:ATP-dependent RecD-like DNA helicase [Xanthobacteraceae bacterium]